MGFNVRRFHKLYKRQQEYNVVRVLLVRDSLVRLTSPRFTSPRFTSPVQSSPVQSSPVLPIQYNIEQLSTSDWAHTPSSVAPLKSLYFIGPLYVAAPHPGRRIGKHGTLCYYLNLPAFRGTKMRLNKQTLNGDKPENLGLLFMSGLKYDKCFPVQLTR